ncbi:hypothetical protein Agabi119p4_7914 [Agaricus bisporus var. burnettii]|uniref:Nickel/cobalt efflux system n=1 Tax=Agaricus bisporus var. burnettii TaxID=192524 RepID=A0A8H7C844_AGABI|nr:hypothetical protein Agabi119p4_7914 [Agaricus bisporus var. burnettii]
MAHWRSRISRPHIRLTVLGRSLLLLLCEILANAACWIVAVILFYRSTTRSNLGLSLLAWTLGLRHALDADHISAIDNATRSLISSGQLPISCGLFFSLGHSTIVIVVTVAIAISTDVYDRMSGVGNVGGIVGAAVSGAFLFIVGLANSFILWRILRQRRREKQRQERIKCGESVEPPQPPEKNSMLMMRILGPIVTFVNRPWKMYPVGVLFGFGFDTASSIALLAISAIAKQDSNGHRISPSHVIILPLLFTAGMTLIDSLDSILMLYSYAGLIENPSRWKIFEPRQSQIEVPEKEGDITQEKDVKDTKGTDLEENQSQPTVTALQDQIAIETTAKMNVMSGLSIVLTLMSIVVAFAISLITIMGLIGEHCSQCAAAASAEDGGGLAGAWWRSWANAGEHSGYIGIGIVGAVVSIVTIWYLTRWTIHRFQRRIRNKAATSIQY